MWKIVILVIVSRDKYCYKFGATDGIQQNKDQVMIIRRTK